MKQVGWVTNEVPQDWNKVSTAAPPPLEPGLYRARFVSAKPAPTKKEQKPAIALELEIFEDGSGKALERKAKARDTMVLTIAAQWRQKQIAGALDIPYIKNFEVDTAEDYCGDLIQGSRDGFYVKMKQRSFEAQDGETVTLHEVDRYLSAKEAQSSKSTSNGASNGASEEAPKRPRRGSADATAS